MKKLLLLILLFISSAYAMQAPQPHNEESIEITLTNPTRVFNNFYQILALDGKKQVGYLTFHYFANNPTQWGLGSFSVQQAYRENHIGQALLKECIDYIKSQQARQLTWQAIPLDQAINLDTLIKIYQKIIIKLGFAPEALIIGPREGSGLTQQVTMSLQLT
ncbi:MAG: hypothetical protein AMXMBFR12_00510 [Candidatus Babeliales bacterium]